MQTEKFMNTLEEYEKKSKDTGLEEKELNGLIRDANKVKPENEELERMIYEKLTNIRRRTLSTTKWNLLLDDVTEIGNTEHKSTEEFKLITNFLKEVERLRLSTITTKDFNLLKKNYKATLPVAKKYLLPYMYQMFENEVNKKMRVLESRTNRISKNNFNNWLKEQRQKSQFSLKELSDKTGISVSYLYRLESTNESVPSPKMLEKLAEVFGVKVEEIPLQAEPKRRGRPRKTEQKVSEIVKTAKREKTRDIIEIITSENISFNNRMLNEEERDALKGCLMFIFDDSKNISEILRFFNQLSILK